MMKLFRVSRGATVFIAVLFFVAISELASAQTPTSDLDYSADKWHVAVSPYLWLAGMSGTVGIDGHQAQVNQSFTDIFSNLKFGVMGVTEVSRGPLSILTDAMYIKLGNETAVPVQGLPPGTVSVNASLSNFVLTPYLGYRLLGKKRASIYILTGLRYYHLSASINPSIAGVGSLTYSTSDNWVDYVEGAHFKFQLSRRIVAYALGDVGGGGSVFTYQVVGGAGYEWSKKWSTSLSYRRLYYQRYTNLNVEPTEQGLVLGVTYRIR
jgi:opacity protein-like surface antigen